MSGILRNLITIVLAYFSRQRFDARAQVTSFYWITPLDCGASNLKSDKYLQLVEAAQLDFLIKTKLFRTLMRDGVAFVNVAQLIRFAKPIKMFDRVRIETHVDYLDEKCTYFSHLVFVDDLQHAEVLVKMKFKNGPVTVPPPQLLGTEAANKPAHLESWDQVLNAMS